MNRQLTVDWKTKTIIVISILLWIIIFAIQCYYANIPICQDLENIGTNSMQWSSDTCWGGWSN